MGATNFPNGINAGDNAGGSATLAINGVPVPPIAMGTALLAATGMGTITTGLGGNIASVVAILRNQPAAGGTTFGYVAGSAVGTSGQVVFTYYDKAGVQGTATAPIYWIASGTA